MLRALTLALLLLATPAMALEQCHTRERFSDFLDVDTFEDARSGAVRVWQPVFACRMDNLRIWQTLVITASVEVTSTLPHYVSAVCRIVINGSYDDQPPYKDAFFIGPGGGPNIERERRHEPLSRVVIWQPIANFSRNVSFMCRMLSKHAEPGARVALNQAGGGLSVLVLE